MTRLQSRLNARYSRAVATGTRADVLRAQDAVIGDALYRYHQSHITPTHRSIRQHGLYATARQMFKNGTHFVDAYVCIFGVMPRHV